VKRPICPSTKVKRSLRPDFTRGPKKNLKNSSRAWSGIGGIGGDERKAKDRGEAGED